MRALEALASAHALLSRVVATGGQDGRKRPHVSGVAAFRSRDPPDAFFFYLVDAHDRVKRDVRAFDAVELLLQPFLRRIDHDLRTPSKGQIFDFDETEKPTLGDLAGVNLIDLALVEKDNLINVLVRHAARFYQFFNKLFILIPPLPPAGPRGRGRIRTDSLRESVFKYCHLL